MKRIFFTLIFILAINSLQSQSKKLTLINEINLNNLNLKNLEVFSIELLTNKNKRIGKHKCINLNGLIKGNSNLLVEIIDKKGNISYITSDDLDDEISQQPPFLFIDDVVSTLGDTLVLGEKELSKLEDNKLLNSELSSITNFRLFVNINNWTNKMTSKYIKPNTIIFPVDKSTKRWIVNADRIRIYKFD